MAGLTLIACQYVRQAFARCCPPIVAGYATGRGGTVVKACRSPGDTGMAIRTIGSSGQVASVLALRANTIVAACAGAGNTAMVDYCEGPDIIILANLTLRTGG